MALGARPKPACAWTTPTAVAAGGAAARACGLRSAAVRQVGRTGDPGAARVGGSRGRLLDQDRPVEYDPDAPPIAWGGVRLRPTGARWNALPHLVTAAPSAYLGRRARGRVAARRRRRARPAWRRGRRLLGARCRAAPGPSAVHRRGNRSR